MSLTAIRFPWKLKRLHYQEKCSETLGLVRSSPSKFSSRHIDCKGYPIRRCTSRGHLLTPKCHFASSTSTAIWSRILLQTGKAASSIRSCQNQTKTARSFKIAKKEVQMKFRAILTPFGLTSILQRLSRSSQRRQCRRHQIFNQSLWMVSKYLQKAPCQISSQTDTV